MAMSGDWDERTVVASQAQISSEVSSDAVILNLSSGVYFSLNRVGSRIWELIQEPRSVREVRDTLVGEFDVDPERCQQDIVSLLEELDAKGLVEFSDGTTA